MLAQTTNLQEKQTNSGRAEVSLLNGIRISKSKNSLRNSVPPRLLSVSGLDT
jgi:hypothetical protein